jgi:hypothetical protein
MKLPTDVTINFALLQQYTSTNQSRDALTQLLLRVEDSIQCLHSRCRVLAVRDVITGSDRWWTANLYKDGKGGVKLSRQMLYLRVVLMAI